MVQNDYTTDTLYNNFDFYQNCFSLNYSNKSYKQIYINKCRENGKHEPNQVRQTYYDNNNEMGDNTYNFGQVTINMIQNICINKYSLNHRHMLVNEMYDAQQVYFKQLQS